MPARGSRCCLALSNKGKGWTGGAPVCSPHYSPAAHFYSCARWCGDCAVPIPWWTCPTFGSGTPCYLGLDCFLFRFCLVTTIILVPQSLAIHGFEANQIGPAVIWSAIPLLLIAFVAALILLARTLIRACFWLPVLRSWLLPAT